MMRPNRKNHNVRNKRKKNCPECDGTTPVRLKTEKRRDGNYVVCPRCGFEERYSSGKDDRRNGGDDEW